MNILHTLRKPQNAIILSLFVLLFSCSQHELRSNNFEYALYNSFKNGNIEMFNFNVSQMKATSSNSSDILSDINEHYGTNLDVPTELIDLFTNQNRTRLTITEKSLQEGWITQSDIEMTDNLVIDIHQSGFDNAINTFKNKSLSTNLSEDEFSQRNTLVNVLEIANDENPDLFNSDYSLESGGLWPWSCLWAVILFIVAIIGVLLCVTWVLCGFALYALALASNELIDECN